MNLRQLKPKLGTYLVKKIPNRKLDENLTALLTTTDFTSHTFFTMKYIHYTKYD